MARLHSLLRGRVQSRSGISLARWLALDRADAVYYATQFSESLINHLSATSLPSSGGQSGSGSGVSSSRQQTLDSHIQSRIQSELARLREQEQSVRQEIERALEKENLDREKGSESGGVAHSASLLKDLEDLEKRTMGLREESRKSLDSGAWKSLEQDRDSLLKCFRWVPVGLEV